MQASSEVQYSKTDGFNGFLDTYGTNWVQYSGNRITYVGYNLVQYDNATGRLSMIGSNPVIYGKDGKIELIGRNVVVYSGSRVSTVGNKWIKYIQSTNSK